MPKPALIAPILSLIILGCCRKTVKIWSNRYSNNQVPIFHLLQIPLFIQQFLNWQCTMQKFPRPSPFEFFAFYSCSALIIHSLLGNLPRSLTTSLVQTILPGSIPPPIACNCCFCLVILNFFSETSVINCEDNRDEFR